MWGSCEEHEEWDTTVAKIIFMWSVDVMTWLNGWNLKLEKVNIDAADYICKGFRMLTYQFSELISYFFLTQ